MGKEKLDVNNSKQKTKRSKLKNWFLAWVLAITLSLTWCWDWNWNDSKNKDKESTKIEQSDTQRKTESTVEIDSVELEKIQRAKEQGWTDKDLNRNKRMYNKSSKKARFLNEIVTIGDDAIFVKDFETGMERMINISSFVVGSKYGYTGPTHSISEFSVYFRPGDIVQIPIDIRTIPESKLKKEGKMSAQEYYNDNYILYDWPGATNEWDANWGPWKPHYIVIVYDLDTCNKRKEECQNHRIHAKIQADSTEIGQEIADDI